MKYIEKIRSYRIWNFAIFDFVVSFVGMYILSIILNVNPIRMLLLTIPLGILIHYLLGIETPLNKLFLSKNNLIIKLIVVLMVILAY